MIRISPNFLQVFPTTQQQMNFCTFNKNAISELIQKVETSLFSSSVKGRIFLGHSGTVLSLLPWGPLLYTGSEDTKIRLFNHVNGACIDVLSGHQGGVRRLNKIHGNLLIKSSDDKTSKLWSVVDRKCVFTEENSKKKSDEIAIPHDHILFTVQGSDIHIRDQTKKTKIGLLQEHTKPISCLTVQGSILFSGSKDGAIKIWNWRSQTCINTLPLLSTGAVTSLAVQDNKLFVGYNHGYIEEWFFNGSKKDTTFLDKLFTKII